MTGRFAAHEFLEMQEALGTKAAQIELYAVLMEQTHDTELRRILGQQQHNAIQAYNQGISLLQSKGAAQTVMHTPMPQVRTMTTPHVGLQNPEWAPPNPRTSRMTDTSIAQIVLNQHKAGSAISMLWASECVDPHIRQFHMNAAILCQQEAYQVWQWMNARGYYQAPQLADHTMRTMIQAYVPVAGTTTGMMQPPLM